MSEQGPEKLITQPSQIFERIQSKRNAVLASIAISAGGGVALAEADTISERGLPNNPSFRDCANVADDGKLKFTDVDYENVTVAGDALSANVEVKYRVTLPGMSKCPGERSVAVSLKSKQSPERNLGRFLIEGNAFEKEKSSTAFSVYCDVHDDFSVKGSLTSKYKQSGYKTSKTRKNFKTKEFDCIK